MRHLHYKSINIFSLLWKTPIYFIVLTSQAYSLSLTQAYNSAFYNDLSFRQAKYALLADQNNGKIALSALLPQAAISSYIAKNNHDSNLPFNTHPPNYTSKNFEASAEQVIFDIPSYANFKSAQNSSLQALLNYNQTSQALIINTAQLYFNLLLSIDNTNYAKAEQVELNKRLYDVTQKVQAGLMTQSDLEETKAQLERSKASLTQAKQTIANTKDELQDSIGIPFQSIKTLNPKKDLKQDIIMPLRAWENLAIKNNLNLKIYEKNITIAKSKNLAEKGNFLPNIKAFASISNTKYYSEKENNIFGSGNNSTKTKIAGVSLQYPLLTGGYRIFQNNKTKQNIKLAETAYLNEKQITIRKIRQLYRNLHTNLQIIKAESQAILSAKELIKIYKLKLELGAVTMIEVLDNISKLKQDQQKLAQAKYNYLISLLELKMTAGVICPKDIEKINDLFDKNITLLKDSASH